MVARQLLVISKALIGWKQKMLVQKIQLLISQRQKGQILFATFKSRLGMKSTVEKIFRGTSGLCSLTWFS